MLWRTVDQEVFCTIATSLAANQTRSRTGQASASLPGVARFQGIGLWRCAGARLRRGVSGEDQEFPLHPCTDIRGQRGEPRGLDFLGLWLDAEGERILGETLVPDRLAIVLTAREQRGLGDAASRTGELGREGAHDGAEAENCLVPRALERLWHARLRAIERAQEWLRQHQIAVSAEDRRDILALDEDLPALWHAATTTAADRKQILRLLIDSVILDQHREQGKVWFQINWQAGAVSERWLVRRVRSYQDDAHLDLVQQRIRELNAAQRMDDEIAAILNDEGLRTARGEAFTGPLVWL